jgi:hypothetical protein
MGVVYRAHDLRLKRTVALKFIAPELALDERFRERFLRETELAAAFEHPNAVPIHDAGEVDGRLYLAMRFVDGTDLAALLRAEAPLDPARALAICAQVARSLDAAHASGLVHRDVKPSNVLVDVGEHVYLADFGLTRRIVDDGSPPVDGRSLGTPAYVAPEQLEGGPVDRHADIYSLGCLLYECLTGEPPFPRDSQLAVAWAHLEQEPPSASAHNGALPAPVDEVIRLALAKDPADRQPTCAALTAAAEAALGLRAPRRSRRRTALIAAGTALVAALAVAITAVVARSDGRAADPPAFGRPDTVVRIDPETNAIAEVVEVGTDPEAVAVHGHRVWAYNYSDDTIAGFDERTKRVETTVVPVRPLDVSGYAGPVLAADAGGAWFIGLTDADRPVLARIPGRGRRPIYEPLPGEPYGVAVGYGAVWVVVHGERNAQLLRIDPATGHVMHRTRFRGATAIDSVAVGLGYVWVVGSAGKTLYRIDRRTGERRGSVRTDLSVRADRPHLMRRFVWVGPSVFDPRTLDTVRDNLCCEQAEEASGGFGSAWTADPPTGTVVRWGSDWDVQGKTVRVVADPPLFGGGCVTSLAHSARGIWVSVASANDFVCETA